MSTLKSINVQHPSATTINLVNDASGNVAVGGTLTVGGVANALAAPGTTGNVLTSNGTAWTSAAPVSGGSPSAIGQIPFSTNGSTYTATQKIVQGTAVASTSGTSIDFTGIPSWVKRVTVMFNGVSTNGTSIPIIQIGDSGGVETSGYLSSTVGLSNAAAVASSAFTTGFGLVTAGSAPSTVSGNIVLNLMDTSSTWNASGNLARTDTSANYALAGIKQLSPGPLDRVRITTVGGTDTFDAGSINILYE